MRREHDVPHPAGKDERAERRGDLPVQRHEEGETWVHIGNPGYNVSDDVYAMNDPQGATLFKRLKVALAVKALLGGSIRILRCKSRRVDGVCVPMLATRRWVADQRQAENGSNGGSMLSKQPTSDPWPQRLEEPLRLLCSQAPSQPRRPPPPNGGGLARGG